MQSEPEGKERERVYHSLAIDRKHGAVMKEAGLVATATATLALAGPAFASPAPASSQSVRLVNDAGLSGAQIARFMNATRTVINGSLRAIWNTRGSGGRTT
jgi:hypothetical protein